MMRTILGSLLLVLVLVGCGAGHAAVATPGAAAPGGATETAAGAGGRVPLSVFCAGSLMIPFAELEKGFEAANPDVDMQMEAHGSIQVIRHVVDIHERIDVVATADYALLPMLMYTTKDPDTGQPYASWNIHFATNRMVLAYAPTATSDQVPTVENWAEVISRPGVRVGLADPRFDACGYRELMILQLAESYYGRKTLFEDVTMGRFSQPIRAVQEGSGTVIHVPEVLEPRRNATIVLRGSSVQLIPLLQSGDVQYLFEYESVVRQHGLKYTALPDALNLGSPQNADKYGQVSVKLDFRRFASVEPIFKGEVIAYGLTIPSNAPHPAEAARFVAFLLGPEGRRIMAANYHPLLEPVQVDHQERLPALLAPLCEPQ